MDHLGKKFLALYELRVFITVITQPAREFAQVQDTLKFHTKGKNNVKCSYVCNEDIYIGGGGV
jgi:hypothetical protein